MRIGETLIEETFAEAFGMRYSRLIVTAEDEYWLDASIRELAGYSASVIACDAEVGLEQHLSPAETPDGRPGAALLVFGFSVDALAKSVPNRVGQCVMTCPSTAVFDGIQQVEHRSSDSSQNESSVKASERIGLGKKIRFFGDGYQKSKVVDGTRYWRIPVMDGEFLVSDMVSVGRGVAGGNIILQAVDKRAGLSAARRGAQSLAEEPGVITPFPGGVARSGSKVGSRYKALRASTSDAYCPTLRGRVETRLREGVNCVYEIVIDGVSEQRVGQAMATAMREVAGEGVVAIGAGNYGGKLGKFHFQLRNLLDQ